MSFHDTYAPIRWDDLVFADNEVREHLDRYAKGASFDHIILYGPHGSGKSQAAKVLAATSYGRTVTDANLDIVEQVDDIREAIKSWGEGSRFGHTRITNDVRNPYAIVQEVDLYDAKIQVKLRALMDTMVFARFIFTTNRLENVDSGIRDRCDRFELEVPSPAQFAGRAQAVLRAEGISVSDAELQEMLSANATSVRTYMRSLEKVVVGVRGE